MKKYRVYIGIFAVALTVLVFYFFCIHREWSAKKSLSRAQVAKMLAFLKYDQTGINMGKNMWRVRNVPHQIFPKQFILQMRGTVIILSGIVPV